MGNKPRYSARAFLDETFEVVDVLTINYKEGFMYYDNGRNEAGTLIDLKHVLWIKQANHGRPAGE